MRAVPFAAVLLLAACGSAPRPAPAYKSEPWCVSLDRFLASHAKGHADLACASDDPRAASLTSCALVRVRIRRLPSGTVYDGAPSLEAPPKSWLARALAALPSDTRRITIELRDVELQSLDAPGAALARAAEQRTCQELRRSLCLDESEVIEARIVARPVIRISAGAGEPEQAIQLPSPVVIASRAATAGYVLGDRAACRGVGGRAPNRQELAAFREVKTRFAIAWLGSVQCQMLTASLPMLNSLCAGNPCSPLSLFRQIYGEPLSELDPRQRQSICEALDAEPSLAACGVDVGERGAFSCQALAPWLKKHGDKPWCEMGFGAFCGNGILAPRNAPLQIEIARDMLAHVPAAKRHCVADRLLESWASYAPASFGDAKNAWTELSERCQPIGCNFGRVTTESPWQDVQRAWLSSLLAHFSEPGSLSVNPGCQSVWLAYDERWSIAPGATSGFGLSPADPAKLRQAAEQFAARE